MHTSGVQLEIWYVLTNLMISSFQLVRSPDLWWLFWQHHQKQLYIFSWSSGNDLIMHHYRAAQHHLADSSFRRLRTKVCRSTISNSHYEIKVKTQTLLNFSSGFPREWSNTSCAASCGGHSWLRYSISCVIFVSIFCRCFNSASATCSVDSGMPQGPVAIFQF